jgi:heme A synthase
MFEIFPYIARVIHIASAILLLGGLFYAFNLSKYNMLPPSPIHGFRPAVWSLVAALFLTGTYNLMLKMPVPKEYHMLFGVKFLLFLHIAAVSMILVKPSTTPEKRARMLTGLAVSGACLILISSALRAITL